MSKPHERLYLSQFPTYSQLAQLEELYEAAKQDAQEAEAYAAELEAKLEKAVEALEMFIRLDEDYSPFGGELMEDRVKRTWDNASTTLAELKGETDD
jgi:23S rRNA pseudoU1915 N3-methylase RlmH